MQTLNLLTCNLNQIRLLLPSWSNGTILEALRKIRSTWQAYADKMPDVEVEKFLRKDAIIRNELSSRMKAKGLTKSEIHIAQEKLIGHKTSESPFRKR